MRSLYKENHDGYWRNEISVDKGNTQGLWRTLHGVLGDPARDDTSHIPLTTTTKDEIDSVRTTTAARRCMMFRSGSRHRLVSSPL